MKNKKRLWIIVGIVAALIVLILIMFFLFQGKEQPKKEIIVVDNIKEYGYTLDDNETDSYNEEFKKLKKILLEETVDESAYATSIAKLFIIDFFTLDNKLTKTDIGGIQFINDEIKENFSKKASNTFYKYLENNLDGKRNNVYPLVTKFEQESIEKITYKVKDDQVEAYQVSLEWSYSKETNYQKKAILILTKQEKKLSIVEIRNPQENE